MRIWTAFMVCLSLPALASENDVPHEVKEAVATVIDSTQVFVPAKPIELSGPKYPRQSLRKGQEAWIQVSYCIDESGTPQNISIADSIGDEPFEQEAIKAVQSWRFEPALLDGEPSWQSRNSKVVIFAIERDDLGAGMDFIRQYKKIGKLIGEGNLEAADTIFQSLFDDEGLSLYEFAKLWALRVRYEVLRGDLHLVDLALHRATVSDGEWIEKKSYLALLAMRVRVELGLGKYRASIQAYKKLKKKAGEDAASVLELEPVMSKLHAAIDSESALITEAEIRRKGECYACDDSYVFSLVRRDIAFANIEGELSSIEMRCTHKHLRSEISDLVEWHVPKAWGACTLHVYGKPGTTFDVVHMPAP